MWRNLLVYSLQSGLGALMLLLGTQSSVGGTLTATIHNPNGVTATSISLRHSGTAPPNTSWGNQFWSTASIAAGATVNPVADFNENNAYVWVRYTVNSVVYVTAAQFVVTHTSNPSLSFTLSPAGPATSCIDVKTTNNGRSRVQYNVYTNGVFAAKSLWVNPGETYTFSYCGTTRPEITMSRDTYLPDGTKTTDFGRTIGTNDPGWTTSGAAGVNTGTDPGRTPTAVAATVGNGVIPWNNSATAAATEDSLRKGFEANYNLGTVTGAISAEQLSGILGLLQQLRNDVSGGFININGTMVSGNAILQAIKNAIDGHTGLLTQIEANTSYGYATVNAVQTAGQTLLESKALQQVANAYLASLTNAAQAAVNELTVIKSNTGGQNAALTAIQNNTAQANTQLNKLNDMIPYLEGIRNYSGDSATRLQQINEHVGNSRQLLTNIEYDIEAGNNKLDGIWNSIDAVKASIDSATNHFGTMKRGLDSITNSLGDVIRAVDTNRVDTTNWLRKILAKLPNYDTQTHNYAGSAAEGETNAEANGGNAMEATASGYGPETAGGIPFADLFDITIMGQTINVNPLNNPTVAAVCEWVRFVVGWLAAVTTVWLVLDMVFTALLASGAWHQTKGVQINVPGLDVLTSVTTAIAARTVIAVILASLVAFWTSWTTDNAGIFALSKDNPFDSRWSSSVRAMIGLLDSFCPIATILGDIALVIATKIALGVVVFVKQMAVRFLPS